MLGCAPALILIKWMRLRPVAVRIAEPEGLPGHAGAVQARLHHIASNHTRPLNRRGNHCDCPISSSGLPNDV